MLSQPLVSVLIPAYNHEKFVEQTIQSICTQSYPNIELLIVDDGSKDYTSLILKRLQKSCAGRFTRFWLETQNNQGTCATLNILTSKATGKYYYLIASDDISTPDAIFKQVSFLEDHPDYVLCVGNNSFIDQYGKPCGWNKHRQVSYTAQDIVYPTFADFLQTVRKLDFNSDEFGSYQTLFAGNYIPNGYLFRSDVFHKFAPFTTQAPLEDWWLMLQLAKYGKMKFINEILFAYRQHPTNTIKNIKRMNALAIQTSRYEYKILKELHQTRRLPKELEKFYKYAKYIQASFQYKSQIYSMLHKFVKWIRGSYDIALL